MATILVIDDEADVRTAASLALRKSGHTVLEAANSHDGLRIANAEVPDLIISDICMEGGDGIALLKQIRSNPLTAAAPFIFMSGHANHDTMLAGAEQAADGILPKPFTLHTLITTVAQRLNREGMARQRTEEIKFQLLKILEAAPDLIAMVEPASGQFLFLNVTGRKMLGYGAEEDISRVRLDTIHPADKIDELHSTVLPAALTQGVWAGESMFKHLSPPVFVETIRINRRDFKHAPRRRIVHRHRYLRDDFPVRAFPILTTPLAAHRWRVCNCVRRRDCANKPRQSARS